MTGLAGVRVGVLEARLGGELAELVRRRGGEPRCAPAVVEERADARDQVAAALDALAVAPTPLVVLTTGAGVTALLDEARRAGRERDLLEVLSRATLACRGPKPVAALAKAGLRAAVRAGEPYTEVELLRALSEVPLAGRLTALVHHGERSATLAGALASRGARLLELTLYAWRMPEDRGPLRGLVEEITAGRLEAVLFTSQVQARHLFAVAEEMDRAAAVRASLRDQVAVGSIGPTCTRALEELGVAVAVSPARPKMGALVAALEQHLSNPRSET